MAKEPALGWVKVQNGRCHVWDESGRHNPKTMNDVLVVDVADRRAQSLIVLLHDLGMQPRLYAMDDGLSLIVTRGGLCGLEEEN